MCTCILKAEEQAEEIHLHQLNKEFNVFWGDGGGGFVQLLCFICCAGLLRSKQDADYSATFYLRFTLFPLTELNISMIFGGFSGNFYDDETLCQHSVQYNENKLSNRILILIKYFFKLYSSSLLYWYFIITFFKNYLN